MKHIDDIQINKDKVGENMYQKIYERIYDNSKNKDGTEKPNKLLGEFLIIEEGGNGYAYEIYVKDRQGELYKIKGTEISGYYNPGEGGTKNFIEKLIETQDVQIYLKWRKQND